MAFNKNGQVGKALDHSLILESLLNLLLNLNSKEQLKAI